MKKAIFLILSFLFSAGISLPQNHTIDSLKKELQKAKEDTSRINILNSLSLEFANSGYYDNAKKCAIEAEKAAEKINYKKGIAKAFNNIGVVYDYQGNYPEALKIYLQSLKIREEIGDRKGIINSYNNIGIIYTNQSNYPEALKNLSFALKLSESDPEYSGERGNKKRIADIYINIGVVYARQINYSEALKNYFQALKISEEIGDNQNIATVYINIGYVYYLQGNYNPALKNYLQALKIQEETGNQGGIVISHLDIGNVFIKQKKYNEARNYLMDALRESIEIGAKDYLKECYNSLAELAEATGDYKNAFEYHKLYSEIKDTLLNESNSKQIAEMKTKYETEKKDNEISGQEAEIKKQKFTKYAAFFFAALILLTALVGFNNIRIKNKAAQLVKANEVRQKISRDLHDEIGAGLTSISMACEQAKMKMNSGMAIDNTEFEKIRTQSREVNEKLREVVWATNPENDNLEVLLSYMRNYVSKYFDNSAIEYSLHLPDEVPGLNLKPEVSRNLIFVMKEALNNSVKHSKATLVEVLFSLGENKNYTLQITDNGKGIDYDSIPANRSGLGNMRKRIEEIKGKFELISEKGKGTRIEITGNLA